jgi:hypothetical protein
MAVTSQGHRIFSIDKKLCLKVFDVNKSELIFDKSLLDMKGFPVSMAYFDPFNFGYMYLLKAYDDVVAFTCDLGTLVFKIVL